MQRLITVADDLGVEIDGAAFPHRLYQFTLAHSGWRHATLVAGGESFLALKTEGRKRSRLSPAKIIYAERPR
jgi:hypothetical protein